jgi:citrate/tricarballylate utilization protein
MQHSALPLAEAQRQFLICSACRYCEGYCATFPAIESRTEVTSADVAYIANLCHDCRACYQACMYTAPHEFAVDIPKLLTEARLRTYEQRSVPASGVAAIALAVLLAAIALTGRWQQLALAHGGPGAFYRVVPFSWMLVPALALSAWAAYVLAAAGRRLVRDVAPGARPTFADWLGALNDGITLAYMKGGGAGCYYPEIDTPSQVRRVLHVTLVLGIASAFAATLAAAFTQDVLGVLPPYPLLSAPVLLGTAGGVLVLAGAIGLLILKARRAPGSLDVDAMVKLDVAFLMALIAVAGTGLLLLVLRATPSMGGLLVVHLAAVAALFISAPYGKFVHVPLRLAALLLFRVEEARGGKR